MAKSYWTKLCSKASRQAPLMLDHPIRNPRRGGHEALLEEAPSFNTGQQHPPNRHQIGVANCQLPVSNRSLAKNGSMMRQKRLAGASGELGGGRTADVVELGSKPVTKPPGNARRQHVSQVEFGSAALPGDSTSVFINELSPGLTAIVNSLGALRRLCAAGNQADLRTSRQVVEEAAEQAHVATLAIRQFWQDFA
jgi:hypothetical protein